MISSWAGIGLSRLPQITPHQLLVAIERLQALHLAAADTERVFTDLLADLVALTNSSSGVFVEALPGPDGQLVPGKRFGESDDPDVPYAVEEVLRIGRFVADGVLGVPLAHGGGLAGVAVLAGRPGGYDSDLTDFLRPLLMTAAVVLQARQQGRQFRRRGELLRESERRLQDVFESINDVAWSFTLPDRRMIYLSPGVEEIYGIPSAALQADPGLFLRMVHPDDREEVKRKGDEVLEKGSGSCVYRIIRPDGAVRWIQRRAQASYGSDGRPSRISGVHTDITGLKQMEESLRQSQQRLERLVEERTVLLTGEVVQRCKAEAQLRDSERHFRLLAENCTDVISQHTPEGVCLYVTPNCKPMLGYETEELLFRKPVQQYHPDDVPAIRATHERLLAGAESCTIEYRLGRKDGSYAWVETTSRAVRNSKGEIAEIVCVTRDISARRQVDLALRQTEAAMSALEERRQLESRLQEGLKREALTVLAGGVAHDFNNLLTAILGYADLARMQVPAGNPVSGYLDQILKSSQRAAQLTRQMLAYSGRGRSLKSMVPLDELLRDMESLIRASVPGTCAIRLELGGAPVVEADAGQLRQVVLNLVLNASEAIGEKPGVVTLRTGAWEGGGAGSGPGEDPLPVGKYVLLEVVDDGGGMAPEVRERIFDPFFTTKFIGRGLGLAAVHGIVRAHGGALRVATEPGRGTAMRVLLPLPSHAS